MVLVEDCALHCVNINMSIITTPPPRSPRTHTQSNGEGVCASYSNVPMMRMNYKKNHIRFVEILWIEMNLHIHYTFISNLEVHNIFLVV